LFVGTRNLPIANRSRVSSADTVRTANLQGGGSFHGGVYGRSVVEDAAARINFSLG